MMMCFVGCISDCAESFESSQNSKVSLIKNDSNIINDK